MAETITNKKKQSMATLICQYFRLQGESLADVKRQYMDLTETDKLQLASAIAKAQGLTEDECSFGFVEY